jgi:hypothetical protein
MQQRNAPVGIFQSLALPFDFMSSVVVKYIPLKPIFIVGNSQKPLGGRSREYCGWMMRRLFFSVGNCCTTSDIWLGVLS